MLEGRSHIGGGELARWLLLAGFVLAGIVMYFMYAPSSQPVIRPPAAEESP